MVKAIYLLGFVTSVLLVLTHVAIKNHNYNNNARQLTSKRFDAALDERVEEWKKRKSHRRNSANIRHRLVNDFGIVVADEQPDFNELNSVSNNNNDDGIDKRERKTALNAHGNDTTSVTVLSSVIEHDPTIDENAVPLSYKYYAESRERLPECSTTSPADRIALLHVHQTGNPIISNIFYRYGDYNNLYFALPKAPVFQHHWPLRFHPSYVDKSLLHRSKANFILNAGRNNEAKLRGMLSSKTLYLAMLRDPVSHFRDIYSFTKMKQRMRLISPNRTDEENFLSFTLNPLKTIDLVINVTQQFDTLFHLLKNPQLFDLGFEVNDYQKSVDLQAVIKELDEQLSLVLIREFLDESLVLLQRLLCWDLSDMVYMKRFAQYQESKATKDIATSEFTKDNIRSWNKEDNILYNHFNATFWKKIESIEDPLFWDDVKKFKKMNKEFDEECFKDQYIHFNGNNGEDIVDTITIREDVPYETRSTCERLALHEKDYVALLKVKQRQRITDKYNEIIKEHYVTNGTNGKFLYATKVNVSESDKILQFNDDVLPANGETEDNKQEPIENVDILKL